MVICAPHQALGRPLDITPPPSPGTKGSLFLPSCHLPSRQPGQQLDQKGTEEGPHLMGWVPQNSAPKWAAH